MTTLAEIRAAYPQEGFFAEKEWLLSPEPFPLDPQLAEDISRLGHRLRLFLKTCNQFYFRSVKGKLPRWIAGYVDAGKPPELIEIARSKPLRDELPRVIRPDLILTDGGLALTEIDSVPGGIGLTAWLNQTYAADGKWNVIGGGPGMIDGFRSIFPNTPGGSGTDLLISRESSGYRPEMEWLASQLGREDFSVREAESYASVPGRGVYRFFELFDLPNIAASAALLAEVAAGRVRMTAPPKPWLEEKLWLALFRIRPLQPVWHRELSENQFQQLEKLIPWSWIVDPAPLPHHAVLPRLNIHDWDEAARFTQKERELVLKLSGFNERAWGARSVTVGHDVSHNDWAAALREAVTLFPNHPFVMQEFRHARVVEHPYFDRITGAVRTLRGRVRLCPYFFVSAQNETISLGGILATICPEDKKILHGMKDAILVPCRVAG